MSRIERSTDKYNRALVKQLHEADKKEPEGKFDNVEDMLQWLNKDENDTHADGTS